MCEQSAKFGAEMRHEEVTGIEGLDEPYKITHTGDRSYSAKAIIITTGGSHKKLGVLGEEEYAGRGVPNCTVWDGKLFPGRERGGETVEAVRVRELESGQAYDYPTAAAFIYIGFRSNSDFLDGQVPLDEASRIYTDLNMATDVPGVYAAGDIRVNSFRQLGTVVGDGIMAALAAHRYITEV